MNIIEFYRDKTIFVTGCTGFVGKVVLEKLLRSIPLVRKIYVMVRAKKGMSDKQRIAEIFKAELFERFFQENPHMRTEWPSKVQAIVGDLTISGLGLSQEHRNIILNEVDIIINSAASVNFDDPLLEALSINYFGCMRILDLA